MSIDTHSLLDASDIDLSATIVGMPVIDQQSPLCRTGEVTIEPLEGELRANGQPKRRMVIPLLLEEPATATSGQQLQPGFKTTVSFLMDQHKGWTQERANESLKAFLVGVTGDKAIARVPALETLRGQLVRPTFIAQKNDPTRQEVRRWTKG